MSIAWAMRQLCVRIGWVVGRVSCKKIRDAKAEGAMRDELALQRELLSLQKADKDIEQARERIKQQESILHKLEGTGDDEEDAKKLLATFNDALQAMELHRTAIVHEIERLKMEGEPPPLA